MFIQADRIPDGWVQTTANVPPCMPRASERTPGDVTIYTLEALNLHMTPGPAWPVYIPPTEGREDATQ